jgi:hypothetical protein
VLKLGSKLTAACLVLAACETAAPSRPVIQFPSSVELDAIAARPVPTEGADTKRARSEGWRLEGPFPAPFSATAWTPTSPALTQLWTAFRERRPTAVFPETMACVAREIGRFYLGHDALPDDALTTYMVGVCGVAPTAIAIGSVQSEDSRADDLASVATLRAGFVEQIEHVVPGNSPIESGVWLGRKGDHKVAFFVAGEPLMKIDRAVSVPAEGVMRIEGTATVAATVVSGHINRGRFGAEDCVSDISVALPRFRLTCLLKQEDPTAWIDAFYVPPGHVLGYPLLRMYVRPSDDLAVYQPDHFGLELAPGREGQSLSIAVIKALNDVRTLAGLGPVVAAPFEMKRAELLAPHVAYADTSTTDGLTSLNRLTLGLLAGWNVGGDIRSGDFVSTRVAQAQSVQEWLWTSLQTPSARMTLMDPMIEQVAVALLAQDKRQGIWGMATSWSLHHGLDHQADVVKIYKRIIAARQRLGLPMVKRLASVAATLRGDLLRVHRRELTPMEALESSLQTAVDSYGVSMRGWVFEANSLDAITIPEELIARPDLALEVAVSHHRPPGAAWAQYVVLITYVDEGMTARVKAGNRVR